jgi:crossover junction endodeoxyribonuclease RusA
MESVSFSVIGVPVPKGSLTRMPNGAMLPAGSRDSRERASTWRYDVQAAAQDAMHGRPLFLAAIRLSVDVSLPYPQTLIRKYQHGWWPHIKKPDVDKLLRAVMDHLTGIVWKDDAQVIACMVNKRYAWDGRYGANIVVEAYDENQLRTLAESQTRVSAILGALYE